MHLKIAYIIKNGLLKKWNKNDLKTGLIQYKKLLISPQQNATLDTRHTQTHTPGNTHLTSTQAPDNTSTCI